MRHRPHFPICNLQFAFCIFQFSCGFAVLVGAARAQAPSGAPFPFREKPVDYFSAEADDPVAALRDKLERGESTLTYREGAGYLPALLEALHVPVESQMLVFAKNSVHAALISPKNPRALYFDDNVYVGWVPGAPFLEISAVDSRKGAVFYSLRQEAGAGPKIIREESCLLCHASANAGHVPGHLVRSFVTDAQGNPTRGHSRINHDTPFKQRWGGWFVTGETGTLPHQGNLSTAGDLLEFELHPDAARPAVDLKKRLDAAKYPAPHSDVVALLVHDHQTHLHNLLTRVRYEALYNRPENSEAELLRYLLFVDAPPFDSPVLGSSGFEAWFEKQGPRDTRGRSLRQFDLETRLFKYRCSYLIYSPAFDSLPAAVKDRLYRRLWEVLTGRDEFPAFARLPRPERQAVLEILRETKSNLPEYWHADHP